MPTSSTPDFGAEALALHKKHHGKLAVVSKVPLLTREDLSRAYTPGVGQVCLEISKDPKLAYEYTLKRNTVAIVSDGSAILGLGNLGAAAAIPVMEGKAILFKQLAGVDAFPICLNTQDTEEIIKAVKQIAPVFGAVNLEDIAAPRCFEIERRLQEELDIPVMHDDQKGTATVVLAGLINACRVRGSKKEEVKIVLNGAGAAGTAVAQLLVAYGFKNIIAVDSQGAIYMGRPDLTPEKAQLAALTNPGGESGTLAAVLAHADVFIGLSKAGLVTGEMVRSMQPRPIIFALANPVPEIMPAEALAAGAFIVATGRSDFPNQVNNSLGFPGIFRGMLDGGARTFTTKMFIAAAEALAGMVAEPSPTQILPQALDTKVPVVVAAAIIQSIH
jgi:malate dehydrogenase (oxaloacetate-decarboxylating)